MKEIEQLLRSYAEQGSEIAFRELVSRYIDLVYSVACRKVEGDEHLAKDVVQQVFTDLAGKAGSLPKDVMLGGWLHRHTCFVAATTMRTERRRQVREKQAMEMNSLHNDPDAGWKDLAPVLDDAINELGEADRDAIMLRFYERQDLKTVGAKLGVSDDAAQKRVGRALEKLRELLLSRGVALTGAALGVALSERAVKAAPTGLGASVATPALMRTAESAKTLAVRKLAVGALVGLCIVFATFPAWRGSIFGKRGAALREEMKVDGALAQNVVAGTSLNKGAGVDGHSTNGAQANADVVSSKNLNAKEGGILELTILSADTGKPVSGGRVEAGRRDRGKFIRNNYTSDSNGVCRVEFSHQTTELEVTTRIDGLADTHLQWHPDHGEQIPESYKLKLVRPTWIGGTVVGPDGEPVAGAKVGFNHEMDIEADKGRENHAFSWIETKTDKDGRWEINRIAPEMIRRLYGSAKHTNYTESGTVFLGRDRSVEKQLRDGTYVFHMGRAMTVRGIVLDPDGQPVAGANVTAGYLHFSDTKKAKTAADGTFSINGCKPGKHLLSADAKGYAAVTIEAEFSQDAAPFEIRLQPGKPLLLRVVDKDGNPIPKAEVSLDTFPSGRVDEQNKRPKMQIDSHRTTDVEGRLVWNEAPDEEMEFNVSASRFMSSYGVKVHPDGEEHVITLHQAVTIYGKVQDSSNGDPVLGFRIGAGYPKTNFVSGAFEPMWSTIDRFWTKYNGGEYRHTMDESVIRGMGEDLFVFRFEADGYEPYVTRIFKPDEGEVRLDVQLKRADEKYVTVLLPDGTPAGNADVGLGRGGARLEIQPTGISRQDGQILTTDAQGHFVLPADPGVSRVVIVHSQGFIETTKAALEARPEVKLLPWGRIEGLYLSGGKPAPGESVTLDYGTQGGLDVYGDFGAFSATADEQGHFVLAKVPPGHHRLGHWVKDGLGGGTGRSLQPLQEVVVPPGGTTNVVIGSGYKVIAHVRWPAGLNMGEGTKTFAMMHTPAPLPPSNIMDDSAALAKWQQEHPEVVAAWKNVKSYMMNDNGDGSWTAEAVPPGSYVFQVATMHESGKENPARLKGELNIVVPSDPANGVLDAGEVVLTAAQ
jgi:RNA polymerase sigma factor (sigma-70 family)